MRTDKVVLLSEAMEPFAQSMIHLWIQKDGSLIHHTGILNHSVILLEQKSRNNALNSTQK
jgi:hypothetical protein